MGETHASSRQMTSLQADRGSAALDNRPRFMRLKRVAMAAATALVAINIWTGAPLLALWVGSRVVGKTVLSMRAEAEENTSARVGVTALERIVTLIVYVAIIALLLWFILFGGPPFPHN